MLVRGELLFARNRRVGDGALGERAGPSSNSCVACARFADAEAIETGESGAATPRSRFDASPTPATPTDERDKAIRDGSVAGDGVCESNVASTEAATSDLALARFFANWFARLGDFCLANVLETDGRAWVLARATA